MSDTEEEETSDDNRSVLSDLSPTTKKKLLDAGVKLVDSDSQFIAEAEHYQGTIIVQENNNDNNKTSKRGKKSKTVTNDQPTVRNRWAKVSQIVKDENGEDTTIYPFLSMDNWKDIIFVQHLAADRPYKAAFGQQCNTWKKMAEEMSRAHDDKGNLVFKTAISSASLQARFVEYTKFMKQYNINVPFRSGNDDEPTYNILTGVEELVNDYNSFLDLKEDAKENIAKKKNEDKDSAEVLRLAAIGRLKKKRVKRSKAKGTPTTSEYTTSDNEADENETKKYSPSSGSGSRSMMSNINDLLQNNDARDERKLEKIKYHNKKLQLKQQMIDEKIKDNEARREEAIRNQEMMTTQQNMMMKLIETLSKKNNNDDKE